MKRGTDISYPATWHPPQQLPQWQSYTLRVRAQFGGTKCSVTLLKRFLPLLYTFRVWHKCACEKERMWTAESHAVTTKIETPETPRCNATYQPKYLKSVVLLVRLQY